MGLIGHCIPEGRDAKNPDAAGLKSLLVTGALKDKIRTKLNERKRSVIQIEDVEANSKDKT